MLRQLPALLLRPGSALGQMQQLLPLASLSSSSSVAALLAGAASCGDHSARGLQTQGLQLRGGLASGCTGSSSSSNDNAPNGMSACATRAPIGRHFATGPSGAGPVYVVFGASGGIGGALVRQLQVGAASSAARLVVSGQDQAALDALNKGSQGGEGALLAVAGDARDPAQVERVVQAAVQRYGRVDGVAACVGDVRTGAAVSTTLQAFREELETNLVTAFNITQAAIKAMLLNSGVGGSVVLVSAAVASTGIPHFEAMSAAKAGVEGLARSAAATYAPQRLRVNCVAPGLTDTRQAEQFVNKGQGVKDASVALHPEKRFATPEDIARAMAFLLAPENDFITGQVLGVDGGLSTLTPTPMQQQQPASADKKADMQ